MTTTFTTSTTFTRTHARYLASKVAADLRQMRCFYGRPTESEIEDYIEELTELLVGGYLDSVDYGFQDKDGWVVALSYRVGYDGTLVADDRAGRVRADADVSIARWYSYLRKKDKWWRLTTDERNRIESAISVKRTPASEPRTGAGVWIEDRTYSCNGTGLTRRTFRTI